MRGAFSLDISPNLTIVTKKKSKLFELQITDKYLQNELPFSVKPLEHLVMENFERCSYSHFPSSALNSSYDLNVSKSKKNHLKMSKFFVSFST